MKNKKFCFSFLLAVFTASFAFSQVTIPWTQVSKSGSNLTDLTTRDYGDLQNKPTTLSGYGITDAQPLDSDLTAIAAIATTSYGRALLAYAGAPQLSAALRRTDYSRLMLKANPVLAYGHWQAVSTTTAPTITQSSSSAITGTTFADPATVNRYASNETMVFRAGAYRKGTSHPDDKVFAVSRGYSPNSVWHYEAEWMTDATEFEVIVKHGGQTPVFRFWVNGRLTSLDATALEGSAGNYPRYIRVQFSDARVRHIRFQGYITPINGVRVPTGASVWAPEYSRPIRAVWVGDSFGEGSGASRFRGMAENVGQAMGWEMWNVSSGGTGWNADGAGGRVNFLKRIQTNVINQQPDVVIIQGGINDTTVSNVGEVLDSIAAGCPQAAIIVIGSFWPTASPDAGKVAINATLLAACQARGIPFIDPLAEPWINAGNFAATHSATAATGTAALTGDAVTSVSVSTGGSGYNSTASVSITGGGGSGAAATAVMDGRVLGITLLNGGRGYSTAPTVTLTNAPGDATGSGATAEATVTDGVVTGITVTAPGTGYTQPPTVSFSGPDNSSGAVAVALWGNVVSSVTVTNGGSGYSTAPTVTFSAASDGVHPKQGGHAYYAERIVYAIRRIVAGAASPIY